MNKILLITSKQNLEETIWQQQTDATVEDINSDLQNMARQLQVVYDKIGNDEDITTSEQYILGDAINLINNIEFMEEA